MSSDYVSIKSVPSNTIENDYGADDAEIVCEDNIYVLQPQGVENSDGIKMVPVGIMKSMNDVLVKEISIPPCFVCLIVSKLYDMNELESLGDVHIIKMLICHKNNKKSPLFALYYSFSPARSTNYLDNINVAVLGSFYISLHYIEDGNFKCIKLETYEQFINNDTMFEELTEWLVSDDVQNMLAKYM